MKNCILLLLAFLVACCSLDAAAAFSPASKRRVSPQHCSPSSSPSSSLNMAPKFDKKQQKWVPTSSKEGPDFGYGPTGALFRHGPRPWFERTFKPDDYEQAVLKFMAQDKCDRLTAEGNMDAYLRNPQDWMFDRMESQKRGFKVDYAKEPSVKKIVLTTAWAGIVFFVVGRVLYTFVLRQGDPDFWAFLPWK